MIRTCDARRMAAALMAASLSLSVTAACSAGDGSATQPTSSTPASTVATDGGTTNPGGDVIHPFGADCPNLPDTGDGSLLDLSEKDWITALASVPALAQLSVTTALADLGDDFSRVDEATVFAPTAAAFSSLGLARGRQLLTDPAAAADVLRYHVVRGRLSPEELPGAHRTLSGQTVNVTGSGEDFTVNKSARIVCGNLQTKNATIYLIDKVLVPS